MIKSNTNTVTVHGLQPLTPYEFRVSFVNELGTSEHSRSITLTTQMEGNYDKKTKQNKINSKWNRFIHYSIVTTTTTKSFTDKQIVFYFTDNCCLTLC